MSIISIVKYFLKRPLTLNLFVVLLISLALIRMMNMQKEAFPNIDFDVVTITTAYPGATPVEVEQYVTNLIERVIKDIPGIKDLNSTSTEGLSLISITLSHDLKEEQKKQSIDDIQRAISRLRGLPEEVPEAPLVEEKATDSLPVITATISYDGDYAHLHKQAERLIKKLESVPGVGEVLSHGLSTKEFWVEVDREKLRKNYISLSQLIQVLEQNNINLPGGELSSRNEVILVRTVGQVQTIQEIDDLILRTNDSGVQIKIGDVAVTKETFSERHVSLRMNGMQTLTLLVLKKSTGDIIEVVDAVKAKVDEFKNQNSDSLSGFNIKLIEDRSSFVKNRLNILMNNGISGILLVLVCLLLFISPGISLVAAAGMPVALLGTILLMSYAGMSINLITMFGIVIVLGMLVDDAIIVAENIWHHYENGVDPWTAVVEGTREVILPVFSTILTTIAAFIPLMMVTGVMGELIYAMPLVVILALVASFLEAMIILPSHAYDILKVFDWNKKRLAAKEQSTKKKQKFKVSLSFLSPLINLMTTFYTWSLEWLLKVRYLVLALFLGLGYFTYQFSKENLKFVLFPDTDIVTFFVLAEAPNGVGLAQTSHMTQMLEKEVIGMLSEGEMENYMTTVGLQEKDPADPNKSRGSHLSQIAIYLTPQLERERTAFEIMNSIRSRVEDQGYALGFRKISMVEKNRSGPPIGRPIAVKISGDDLDEINEVSEQMMTVIQRLPGVTDVDKDYVLGKKELMVKIDKGAAATALLSVKEIALNIRAALQGQVATVVYKDGETIDVKVRYQKDQRQALSSLDESYIINRAGIMIPLNRVVYFQISEGVNSIIHYDAKRTVTVTASINKDTTTSSEVNSILKMPLQKLKSEYPNVDFILGGEYENTKESQQSLIESFYIAVFLIYFILCTLFSSLFQPLVILSAVPFGIIGIVYAFHFYQLPLDFMGLVGTIGLSGVVVNDSIVLVDFVNKARAKGMKTIDACLYAGGRRVRAVWLTTLTTVFGLVPMIYGIGGMDVFLRPAAISLSYGLVFGTVLILILVPCLYMIYIDGVNLVRAILRPFTRLVDIELNKIP